MNHSVLTGRAGICLLFFLLLSSCDMQQQATQPYPFEYSNSTMGTSFTIKLSQLPDTTETGILQNKIDALLARINAQMSTYLPESELSQFNASQSTEWQKTSLSLFKVLQESKQVNALSLGAFDVTVGPLVNLWGFGPDPMRFEVPPGTLIEQKRKLVGSQHLYLDEKNTAIRKDINDLYIDLSAVAKGYAVDKVAELLAQEGVADFMVEIGGEIRLKGKNIQHQPWKIAIEKPAADRRMIEKIVSISDIGMATSGDYRNFFEVDGVRYSHTIDPRTGRPITHKLASVTVFSDTTMDADAWATALTVLGPDKGYQLAEKRRIPALFIIKSGDGFVEKATVAFNDFVKVKP